MKTKRLVWLVFAFAFIGLLMTNCTKEGPEGPQGPQGPAGTNGTDGTNGTNGTDGTNGTNGTDGTDGVDANSFCIDCHSAAGMNAIYADWATSGHGLAAYVSYAGYRGSCAPCHSNELFQQYLAGTPNFAYVNVDYPTAIGCATCHSNHTTLEEGLTAPLTADGAVTIWDGTTQFNLDGPSNLCMNCHKSRRGCSDYFGYAGDTLMVGGDTVIVTADETYGFINSTHAGPHHGPQGDILVAFGGYAAAGSYVHEHQELGCVGCHMGENRKHTFHPEIGTCTALCHSGTTFDIGGFQTEVEDRLLAIATALEAAGVLDATHEPIVGVYTYALVKAWWNYIYLEEDRSMGVHNPAYVDAMLTETETLLGI